MKSQAAPTSKPTPRPTPKVQTYPWDLPGLSPDSKVLPATAADSATYSKQEGSIAEIRTSLKVIRLLVGLLCLCGMGLLAAEYVAAQRISRMEAATLASRKESEAIKTLLNDRDKQFAEALARVEKSLRQDPPARPKSGR